MNKPKRKGGDRQSNQYRKWSKVENCSHVIDRHIEKSNGHEKIIERERIETKTISKAVEEKKQIVKHIGKTIETLKNKDPKRLITTSKLGILTQSKIHSQLKNFMISYPYWRILNSKAEGKTLMDLLIISKESFSCVPFVLVTWIDLINSGIPLENYEIAYIVQLKLTWRAMKQQLHDTMYNSQYIIQRDLETTQMTLLSFTEDCVATINLIIPSLSIDIYVDLDQVDACFLMTIPCENSTEMILHKVHQLSLRIPVNDRFDLGC